MQAQARPGVPPDEVEVEVEIDDGRCEKEEQRSGLAINVGEICARDCKRCWVTRFKSIKKSQECANKIIIHQIWKIGSITRLVIAKGGETVRGPSSRAMRTFRSKAMHSGRSSSSRTHHCAALGAVIEIAWGAAELLAAGIDSTLRHFVEFAESGNEGVVGGAVYK